MADQKFVQLTPHPALERLKKLGVQPKKGPMTDAAKEALQEMSDEQKAGFKTRFKDAIKQYYELQDQVNKAVAETNKKIQGIYKNMTQMANNIETMFGVNVKGGEVDSVADNADTEAEPPPEGEHPPQP